MGNAWQVGDQIQGRWEICKVLRGGAAVVYVVYDHVFREPFAAKTFRDEIFAQNPEIADRFMRESLAWIKLDFHPNITQARMFEKIDGKPFLFLEYVGGGDLAGWIGTPRLTEDLPRVLQFAIQFCDGMIYATRKGIRVHRDIKPQNCLITRDGVLKVTDFGLVKMLDDDVVEFGNIRRGQMLCLTAAAVGTCTHMAPEQFEDASQVDLRADIYSFGVMLFQMVSGELPFNGQSWKDFEQMHKSQLPRRLTDTDPELAQLIQICLAKDSLRRFANFDQLRERLSLLFQRVTGMPPPIPVRGAELDAVQWNNKGSSLDNLGMHKEALACYDSALQAKPSFAPAWFNKGVALCETGQVEQALSCYQRALELHPNAENVWSNMGVALKSLGKTEESLACYERALQVNPRYPNAWINKGIILKSLGKNEDALACYERALLLNPKDERGWTNKGNLLFVLKRPREALTCYERALDLNPILDRAWMNRGISLDELGRHEEALRCYCKAIEINPLLGQAWFLHGLTLMRVFHRYREALPYLEQAQRIGSKEASPLLEMCRNTLANQVG